ncbi:hypothetical protein VCRA2110O2_30271 [Vibrio crassostreae]|nr:hypothetical protein VCHA44O286_50105 [Vibrio chagasii]CAK2867970.1 hypothetical protein VCRA2110O2_30271 [Vibrio crassostreae]
MTLRFIKLTILLELPELARVLTLHFELECQPYQLVTKGRNQNRAHSQ